MDAGAARVAEALELQPGWRQVLATLTSEIAPGAPAVRAALGVEE